jgi:hypothetical protein
MIKQVTVETADMLSREILSRTHGEWIYRGQCDAAWPLETSFYRFSAHMTKLRYGAQPLTGSAKLTWYRTLREMEHRAYAQYRQQVRPKPGITASVDMFVSLADIQHYGCPTRLLDFSWLPYIALFFALERGDNDCALYAVRASEPLVLSHPEEIDAQHFWGEKGADSPMVYLFTPPYGNDRIQKQKGAFLIPTTTVVPFEQVAQHIGLQVVKYILPARLRPECIAMLARMGIEPASVYPETEGQVRSLAWDIQAKVLTCPL